MTRLYLILIAVLMALAVALAYWNSLPTEFEKKAQQAQVNKAHCKGEVTYPEMVGEKK